MVTPVGVIDLEHLYLGLDHLVITLVGTADLFRLYPELDYTKTVATLETSSPWTAYTSYRAR